MRFTESVETPSGTITAEAYKCDTCGKPKLLESLHYAGWLMVKNAGYNVWASVSSQLVNPPDAVLKDVAFCSMKCLVSYWQADLNERENAQGVA